MITIKGPCFHGPFNVILYDESADVIGFGTDLARTAFHVTRDLIGAFNKVDAVKVLCKEYNRNDAGIDY